MRILREAWPSALDNKRASVIFSNHYMIAHGLGLIVIPEHYVPEFKKKLITYYESADIREIRYFLKEKCWRKIKEWSRHAKSLLIHFGTVIIWRGAWEGLPFVMAEEDQIGMEHLSKRKPNLLFFWFLLPFIIYHIRKLLLLDWGILYRKNMWKLHKNVVLLSVYKKEHRILYSMPSCIFPKRCYNKTTLKRSVKKPNYRKI